MANPEHLAILENGVNAWNKWRQEHRDIKPDLSEASLQESDLTGANLHRTNLHRANLSLADLTGADLTGASLSEANLSLAELTDADLSYVDLSHTNLYGAKFISAQLRGANMSGTDLTKTNLSLANITDANISAATAAYTIFGALDLSAVKGLEEVEHLGPSIIGIDTIYKSRGKIPEIFLRGAGVPDSFITYIGSLVGKPIEFYSCFISYSSKDQSFADRLYADLQAAGVRCWFAPEDLKIGDCFRDRIDESIRLHDKLLIILSNNSVPSPWVATEVEAAFEREHRQPDRLVLFPIRLDDAVMTTSQAWAADIRRRRHIGDFSGWKEHDSYTKGFNRLLRDLKASTCGSAFSRRSRTRRSGEVDTLAPGKQQWPCARLSQSRKTEVPSPGHRCFVRSDSAGA